DGFLFGLEVLFADTVDTGGDGLLGVDVGADTRWHGHVGDADRFVEGEFGDVDDELVGDVGRFGADRQFEQRLVDGAVLVEDDPGFALENDRNIDDDLDVGGNAQEVDVKDIAADRVALHVLDDGHVDIVIDLEVEEDVDAG